MAMNWYDAQAAGRDDRRRIEAENLAAKEAAITLQRQRAAEDRDTAYNEEIRRRKIAELQRLDNIRNAKASRSPTDITNFEKSIGGVGTGIGPGQDGQATYGQIPEFNLDAQSKLATERDAAILQGTKDYDQARLDESMRLTGTQNARDALLKLQEAQKAKGSEQYLPPPNAATAASEVGRSNFQQVFTDSPETDRIQSQVQDFATFVRSGSGTVSGSGSDIFDITNPFATGQSKIDSAESAELAEFYETDVFSNSAAEQWFINNPGELDKIQALIDGDKSDASANTKKRNALVTYYRDTIKPMIEKGGDYLTETQVETGVGAAKPVYTKEQIAEAEAKHKDYMSKIATVINTLDDDLNNAPIFMEKLNKDKRASEKAIQDLYKDQLSKSDALQLAKVASVRLDPSLLDPTQLGGLVEQHYQQRQLLMYKAQNARKVAEISGDWTEYDTLRAEIAEKDVSIYEAIGQQGISDLTLNNDPSRISAVLSEFANTKTIVQPRSDGTYNIITNGRISGEPRTAAEIGELVQMYSSPTYRAQSAANAQKLTEQQIEGAETGQSKATNETNIIKELLTEQLKGINERDKIAFEQQFKDREVKFSSLGDGNGGGFLTNTAGEVVLYNPMPGKSPSGKPLSKFTDISSQIPSGVSQAIRSGTIDFNQSAFWKNIGLPDYLNK